VTFVEYGQFIKKLEFPDGFSPPSELRHDDIVASAITRTHLSDDVAGINASIELIHRTRGGPWPAEPTTEDYNYTYLVWHELEFNERYSLTYAVYNTEPCYLGCAYLSPMGRRTQLTEHLLAYDIDVSWWVTPTAYDQGYYRKVYVSLQHWLADEFPFWKPYYSNVEIPH
jgi:hypothetical protein